MRRLPRRVATGGGVRTARAPDSFFSPRSSALDLSGSNCKRTAGHPGTRGWEDASGALEMTCGGHSHAAEQEALQVKERQEVISKMCNACVWISEKCSSARWSWSQDSFVCGRFMSQANVCHLECRLNELFLLRSKKSSNTVRHWWCVARVWCARQTWTIRDVQITAALSCHPSAFSFRSCCQPCFL